MKKNLLFGAFLALCLGLCLVLSLGMLAAGPSGAAANEQLSPAPAWQQKDGSWNVDYPGQLQNYVNDHFFLRQELISLNNRLTGVLFGHSGKEQVLLGRQGWLFYGSTLADFTGTAPLTDRELFAIGKNLQLMQDYCLKKGTAFAFVVAPNKNSLYPGYMPATGALDPVGNGRRLYTLLRELGVNHVDLYAGFRQEPVLYYATDSHWNQQGAALGADLINAALGKTTDFYQGPWTQSHTPYTGDLYAMLYPAFEGWELEPVYGGTLDFSYVGNAKKPDSIRLQTESPQTGTLLAYRDSFGNLLYPYLAASFGSCTFSRSATYDLTGSHDAVLVEIVERNLRWLLEYVPVMESPVVEMALEGPVQGQVTLIREEQARAPEGLVLWTGTLPGVAENRSPVYVRAQGMVYEAFLTRDNGFAVYLPAGSGPDQLGYLENGQQVQYACMKG